jgi:hypothetical protein
VKDPALTGALLTTVLATPETVTAVLVWIKIVEEPTGKLTVPLQVPVEPLPEATN